MVRLLPGKYEQPHADGTEACSELVVVSQRGPLQFSLDPEAGLQVEPSAGGLASALGTLANQRPMRWVAAAMTEADRVAAKRSRVWRHGETELQLVALPPAVEDLHYGCFANPLLWFVQHNIAERIERPRTPEVIWQAWNGGYRPANAFIAQAAARAASTLHPAFLVQDYHLYLAPRILRQLLPEARIAHFIHIPWPEPSRWTALPREIVRSILHGLLGADLIGFQTAADVERFQATCRAYCGDLVVDRQGSLTLYGDTSTQVRHYPITVNVPDLICASTFPEAQRWWCWFLQAQTDQTIVRVDRLDPAKNIVTGFEAFALLLQREPALRGRVRFLAHLVPSRTELPEYQAEAARAMAAADSVNTRFGTKTWQPVEIVYEQNRPRALAELCLYDVLLVNSLSDGMNLVAKEGAALNSRDGVLVLSRQTGAWDELGQWALGIEPGDVDGTAAALSRALHMSRSERHRRREGLRASVAHTSLDRWLRSQLDDLAEAERSGQQLREMHRLHSFMPERVAL